MEPITHQRQPIGVFPDSATANAALKVLEDAGFPSERLSVVSERLSPVQLEETKIVESGKAAAIAGTVFGAMAGLLLGYMSVSSGLTNEWVKPMLGLLLAGSGVGAFGGVLMGSMTGASVLKSGANAEYVDPDNKFLVFLEDSAEEAARAQRLL